MDWRTAVTTARTLLDEALKDTGAREPDRDYRPADVGGFGIRLKGALGKRTPYWLAGQTKLAQSLLSRYINGHTLPGVEHLVLIADTLDVRVEWLATGRGPARWGQQ